MAEQRATELHSPQPRERQGLELDHAQLPPRSAALIEQIDGKYAQQLHQPFHALPRGRRGRGHTQPKPSAQAAEYLPQDRHRGTPLYP